MSYRIFLCLAAVCLASPQPRLTAEDMNPPPWDLSLPNQTSQTWEVQPTGFVDVGYPYSPTSFNNPFGEPYVTLYGDWNYEEIPGPPQGDPIPTWHVGPGGGALTITVPNNPIGGDTKKVFWQITSDKSVTQGNPPMSNPPGATSTPYPALQWPSPLDNWYTFNGLVEIHPNPASETITFPDLVECTNISEIVVKTVCYTVPEPGTLVFLSTGAVGLLIFGWRQRRRTI